MAADSSVIAEVTRQTSSFDFANPPDGAVLDRWTIPQQLKEFLQRSLDGQEAQTSRAVSLAEIV